MDSQAKKPRKIGKIQKKEKISTKKIIKGKSEPLQKEKETDTSTLKTLNDIFSKAMKIGQSQYSQPERFKMIDSLLKSIAGIADKVIKKRIGSKAIQACLKFSDEQRISSFGKLILTQNFPKYMIGTYSHFLVRKFIKVCNKKEKVIVYDFLKKNIWSLLSTLEGNKVLDCFINKFASHSQIHELKSLVNDFANTNPESLADFAMKLIERTIPKNPVSATLVFSCLKIIIDVERVQIVSKLAESSKFEKLSNSSEGLRLAIAIMHLSENKEKKVILKYLSANISTILTDKKKKYLLIIKAFRSFDDTKALNKFLIKPLLANESILFESHGGENIMSDLLDKSLSSKILKDYEIEGLQTRSKKSDSDRKKEILEYFVPQLLQLYNQENVYSSLQSGNQISILFELCLREFESGTFSLLSKILDAINKSNVNPSESLLLNGNCQKPLKKILNLTIISLENLPKEEVQSFEKIIGFLVLNLKEVLLTRGIFIILGLMESSEKLRDRFSQLLKNEKFEDESKPGIKALKQMIK